MPDESPLEFGKAHARYYTIRSIAFEETLREAGGIRLRRNVNITELDRDALQAWRSSWRGRSHWTGNGGFPWDMLSRRHRQKPRSFHAAIWSNGELCGLAVGWLSRGHTQLTMHYLESAPDARHPLRGDIAYLAFTAAEFYGRAAGARTLLLRNPLPAMAERYARMGFRLALNRRGLVYFDRPIT